MTTSSAEPAGLLIYVNELAPSSADVGRIQSEIRNGLTDVVPARRSRDDYEIQNWQPGVRVQLSEAYRLERALRVIPVSEASQMVATGAFDRMVAD